MSVSTTWAWLCLALCCHHLSTEPAEETVYWNIQQLVRDTMRFHSRLLMRDSPEVVEISNIECIQNINYSIKWDSYNIELAGSPESANSFLLTSWLALTYDISSLEQIVKEFVRWSLVMILIMRPTLHLYHRQYASLQVELVELYNHQVCVVREQARLEFCGM